MNELSIIFNRMGIDTKAVFEAVGTKWNFLNFTPGLVGGHCIGMGYHCPDTRNTKVIDIYNELAEYGIKPLVVDPVADLEEAKSFYEV